MRKFVWVLVCLLALSLFVIRFDCDGYVLPVEEEVVKISNNTSQKLKSVARPVKIR